MIQGFKGGHNWSRVRKLKRNLTGREQERKSDIPDGRNDNNCKELVRPSMQSTGLYSPLHKTVPYPNDDMKRKTQSKKS